MSESESWPTGTTAARRTGSPKNNFIFWGNNVDAYRSGHNEAVLKTVWGNTHGGSNPSASAIQKATSKTDVAFCISHMRGGRNRSKRTGAQVRFCEPDEALPTWITRYRSLVAIYFYKYKENTSYPPVKPTSKTGVGFCISHLKVIVADKQWLF